MRDETTHTLVHSTTQGRYALDDAVSGRELTSGDGVTIYLGGRWVQGSVEHSRSGYYFVAADSSTCGLQAGMKVRV